MADVKPLPPRRAVPWLALGAAAALLGAGLLAIGAATAARPLGRAWSAAREAGAYALEGTTLVRTAGRETAWRVTGRGHAAGPITVTLSPWTGDPADPADSADPADAADGEGAGGAPATTWRIRWPDVVDDAGRPLGRRAIGSVLPAGDPLALLAAGHGARVGPLESVAGRACRRVDFLVGARAYGTWWEAHPGFLPVNGEAGGLWTFQASATAWLDPATARPCRIAARVALPRLGDDRPGTGEVDWRYAWAADAGRQPGPTAAGGTIAP